MYLVSEDNPVQRLQAEDGINLGVARPSKNELSRALRMVFKRCSADKEAEHRAATDIAMEFFQEIVIAHEENPVIFLDKVDCSLWKTKPRNSETINIFFQHTVEGSHHHDVWMLFPEGAFVRPVSSPLKVGPRVSKLHKTDICAVGETDFLRRIPTGCLLSMRLAQKREIV